MLNLYSEEISLRTIGMNVYYLLRKNLKETLIAQRQDLTYQSILVRSQMSEAYRREILEQLFQQVGYRYEFSKGYMLFARYDQPAAPYFRHGVIRASNFTHS